jgi:hypothetical protein
VPSVLFFGEKKEKRRPSESMSVNICSLLVRDVVTIYLNIALNEGSEREREGVMRVQAAAYELKPALLGVSLFNEASSSLISSSHLSV